MSMDQMLISTLQRPGKEGRILKTVRKLFSGPTFAIFFPLLLLMVILVLETKIGLIILVGMVLLAVALLKPKVLYFMLISLFSIEGFAAMENVSYPKIVAVLLIGGLALRLALTREAIPHDNAYKYYFLFLTGSIVSFAFAKQLTVSLYAYSTYVSLFILYVFTRYFLRNEKDIHTALNCLFISTLIAFAIVQFLGLSVRSHISTRISSGIGDPNAFASYILVLIPLVLYRIFHTRGLVRIAYWACLICYLILLVLTGSRGGILGLIGAGGIIVYYYSVGKMRQILVFLIIVSAIMFFVVPEAFWERAALILHPETETEHSISVRLENYKAAVKMFFDYPIAGVGLYNYQFNSGDYGATNKLVVHNSYLEILAGGGLLSFLPFAVILIDAWRKLKLRVRYSIAVRDLLICLKASFVSILITSSFISADHKKILWFLLALISLSYYIAIHQNKYAGDRTFR